jgi:hypothetical protein
VPQLFGSEWIDVQVPPHVTQLHAPFTHVCPGPQIVPQPPQLWSSRVSSVHALEQQLEVAPEHAIAHPPQLVGSYCVSRILPPQQLWPDAHRTPHAPQLLQSPLPARSEQVPLQQAGDWPEQTRPHAPQL